MFYFLNNIFDRKYYEKILSFFCNNKFFFNSRSASSHLAQFEEKTLSMLRSLTQPEASSDLPFSPSNAAYSADGQLLEIDPGNDYLSSRNLLD
jgi:hypothetical protein